MADDLIDWNDWVAVKKNPFPQKPIRKKIIFNTAWNEVEQKLAITCQEHHRIAKDSECRAWTRLLPLNYLAYVHQQLSLVYPCLNPHFSHLQYLNDACKQVSLHLDITENDCKAVEQYLLTASDICGHSLVINTLFENDENTDEEYLEDIDELDRQNYEEAYSRSLEELKGILDMREKADNMLHMATVYALEDEVIANASIALAELYNYHLQPFLNLRELAFSRLQSAQILMNSNEVGARVKEQATLEYADWHLQYIKSIDGIRHLYTDYYTKTTNLITGQRDRMLEDKHRYGHSTFEIYALSRLNHLELFCHEERLKLLHSRRLHKEHIRDKLQQQLITVNDMNDAVEIEDIENEIYLQQIKIMDLRLEGLKEEEALLKKKLSIIAEQKQPKSSEDGEFYDAVEDLIEEIQTDETDTESTTDPKSLALKSKLAGVFRRRAIVRNKKKACVLARQKQKQIQEEEALRLKRHHYLEKKRQERRRLELQRKEQIDEERKATVQRLRAYRMKCNQRRVPFELSPTSSLVESSETIQKSSSEELVLKCDSQTLSENDKALSYSKESMQLLVTPTSSTSDMQYNGESDLDSCCSDSTLVSLTSVAPPLPPPPPPLPVFHIPGKELKGVHAKNPSEPVLNVHGGDASIRLRHVENRSNAASINFDELQAVRKRLRKIPATVDLEKNSEVTSEEEGLCATSKGQKSFSSASAKQIGVSDILLETLHRIRVITVDSDESNSENSSDDDFS